MNFDLSDLPNSKKDRKTSAWVVKYGIPNNIEHVSLSLVFGGSQERYTSLS